MDISARPEKLGEYIVKNKATVRDAASVFGISKSTVHTDVTEKLRRINAALYAEVRQVLDTNKEQRHIRGGIATKEKYRQLKKQEYAADASKIPKMS